MATIESKIVYVVTVDEDELKDLTYAIQNDGRTDTSALYHEFADVIRDEGLDGLTDDDFVDDSGEKKLR